MSSTEIAIPTRNIAYLGRLKPQISNNVNIFHVTLLIYSIRKWHNTISPQFRNPRTFRLDTIFLIASYGATVHVMIYKAGTVM